MARTLFLRAITFFALTGASVFAQQHKFSLPENAHELVAAHKLATAGKEPVARRMALNVEATDALALASPTQDNNNAVLPLFGPDIMDVASQNGVSYCQVTTALNFCDGDFKELFQVLCPISCVQPEEEFCVQNDQLAATYLGAINLAVQGSTCDEFKANMGDRQVFHPDNSWYLFCEHPGLGLMCSEACKINCWYWPPPETMKVFLPSCDDTVAIPTNYYPPMKENRATPDSAANFAGICPP
mmetsp:Transcript_5708/g.6541  ORF Transcript_5708/g.6541 Transcript_5708/m.6541 type:complete len:243 (+) Transcript_5708:56-784(+)|eukprot:CAMPEP_0197847740 /NCGR_PEP_ID=MMETSP1438-20131217/6937_1 /TAXON_ID=1461541 /ORGANISM="Pterosperma sp., Strain CCMP1384" /LENGTH=242 /DNA_ID=CAMNT_0043459747 /DNA_START=52 /DNA_END=780 /DNA_ORIENTATION=+